MVDEMGLFFSYISIIFSIVFGFNLVFEKLLLHPG